MQSMSVRPEQVSLLAGQIRTGSRNINTQLENLDTAVGKLRASWDGEAKEAYQQAQAGWTASLSEMRELLAQIADKTEAIAAQYLSTDQASKRRFIQ
ncbi:WXG100 family type VII secretion target [Microbacterium sp.]|uniref:WXG100 family type VII secretion target n=1 Tax=Microbacterium sp. TaxID=51671 RepID=UPI003F94CC80